MDNTDLRGKCIGGSGDRCDLHFIVENEVVQTKERMEKLEERTDNSFIILNTTLNDLSVKMGSYMVAQEYRDEKSQETRTLTRDNAIDISKLKSSLKSVEDHNKHVADKLDRIDKNLTNLSSDIREMDKTIVGRNAINDIVNNAIVVDKNEGRDRWFDALPVKISVGISFISFIAFFTIKITIMLLAL